MYLASSSTCCLNDSGSSGADGAYAIDGTIKILGFRKVLVIAFVSNV